MDENETTGPERSAQGEAPPQPETQGEAQPSGGAAGPAGGTTPAAGGTVAKRPALSDEEKAAKIAEAKARAAAAKEAGGAAPASTATAPPPAAAGTPKPPVKKKDEGPKPVDASQHPLVQRLKAKFQGEILEALEFLGQLSIRVAPAGIVRICEYLRDEPEAPFNYLSDLTCVHYPERTDAPFEIVYNLYSIPANTRVRLKAAAAAETGIETVTGVWPAANWMEREVYDLFGVFFRRHPDLRRLLLPPDWEGHPFRKDYPLHFVENNWTARHLPETSGVQREQLEQRRGYGLEILSESEERRVRELFRAGREPMPLDRK